jgi:ADP-ribosylglycohydrolase
MAGSDWQTVVEEALRAIPENSWTYRQIAKAVSIGKRHDCVFEAVGELYDEIAILQYFWTSMAPEAVPLALGVYAAARGEFRDSVLGGVNVGRDADIPDEWKQKIRPATGKYVLSAKDQDLVGLAHKLVVLSQGEVTN